MPLAPQDLPSHRPAVVEGDRITLPVAEGERSLPIMALPERLIDWFDGGRRAM